MGSGLGLQRVLGLFDQGIKGHLIADGDVGQHLAVEADIGGLETLDEAAVADAGTAAGGVQADDPQSADLALLLLAIAVGVLPGVLDSVFGVAEELLLIAEVALGVLQDLLAALARRGGVCGTRHVVLCVFEPVGRLVRIHPPGRFRLRSRSD